MKSKCNEDSESYFKYEHFDTDIDVFWLNFSQVTLLELWGVFWQHSLIIFFMILEQKSLNQIRTSLYTLL